MLETSAIRGLGSKIAVDAQDPVNTERPEAARQRMAVIALSVLMVIAAIWFMSWAKGVLVPLAFSMFLAICLTPAVRFLLRFRVPCSVGAALVIVGLTSAIGFGVNHTRDAATEIVDQMPAASRYLRREVNSAVNDPGSMAHRFKVLIDLPHSGDAPLSAKAAAAVAAAQATAAAAAPDNLSDGTRELVELAGQTAAVLFLVYLMLATSGRLQRRIGGIDAIPSAWRNNAQAVFGQIERALYHYLGVLVFTNILVGVSVWAAFRLFGVNYAGVWGFAAAILHFIPYVGPALIAIGSGLYSLIQFDSLPQALLIGASTLALSSIVGVGLQTWLLGRSAGMNIVAVFVSLIFWGWIWGLPGLILGTPITMTLKIICGKVPALQWVDALLDGHARERQVVARRIILRTVLRVETP